MPTYGRPDFVAESIAMFLAQDYPAKELIVLNDCPGQRLFGSFPDVRIVNSDSRWPTLGEKRNSAIEMARGEFIAVWDDDDVYMPWRLSYSLDRISQLRAGIFCPAEFWGYWDGPRLHNHQSHLAWIYHPGMMFRRDVWQAVGGYPHQTLGEDTVFVRNALEHFGIAWSPDPIRPRDRIMILRGRSKYAHSSIPGGVSPPDTTAADFELDPKPIADEALRQAFEDVVQRRQIASKLRLTSQRLLDIEKERFVNDSEIWLDRLTPTSVEIGYGSVGWNGTLGYEERLVEVCGEAMPHAISAHPPSRLVFELEGKFDEFRSRVAINDSAPPDSSAADFLVFGDGKILGLAMNVGSGSGTRVITADTRGVQRLELITQTRRWDYCHAVWCDPVLIRYANLTDSSVIVDPLERAEITIPSNVSPKSLCIATVGSQGYEHWIDDLFGSIFTNAQCPEALLAVFSLGDNDEIRRVAEKYRAVVVPCRPLRPLNVASKSVLYSAGRVIPAERFLCLDADMLVLDDLQPVVSAIDAAPLDAVIACREAKWTSCLGHALGLIYGGKPADIARMVTRPTGDLLASRFVVNDGFFGGRRASLNAVDHELRTFQHADRWVDDQTIGRPWRNQFIFNLALASLDCGLAIDPRYNVQLNCQTAKFDTGTPGVRATVGGRSAAIVHFNGGGRGEASHCRGRFRSNPRPLIHETEPSVGFGDVAQALRRWIGSGSQDLMAWSFYGTSDGGSARVSDPVGFSLLATLFQLIRSNGCHRVLETGTARGVSTACLAAAVSGRPDAMVVTMDIQRMPERDRLWSFLPTVIRDIIRARETDSLDGMQAAIREGEAYHAALLDTVHTAEHVLNEFTLATQLVCPGGLILIHDAVLRYGSVTTALDEIRKRGYGVTRLWTAESGERPDDGLGLALIENRQYL